MYKEPPELASQEVVLEFDSQSSSYTMSLFFFLLLIGLCQGSWLGHVGVGWGFLGVEPQNL